MGPQVSSSEGAAMDEAEVAGCVEHSLDPGAVLGPLLDLVVVAVVRIERVVGFFPHALMPHAATASKGGRLIR